VTEIFRSDSRVPASIASACLRGACCVRDRAELPKALAQRTVDEQDKGMTTIPAKGQFRRERLITPVRPVYGPVARRVSDRCLAAWLFGAAQAGLEPALACAGKREVSGMPIGRSELLRTRLEGESGAPWIRKPLAAVQRAEAAQQVA
jgi:hypothetical protein